MLRSERVRPVRARLRLPAPVGRLGLAGGYRCQWPGTLGAYVAWQWSSGVSCAFFELLGPVNLLGERPGLVALELGFWAAAALAESVVVVFLLRHPRREELAVAGEARAGGPTGPY